MGPITPVMTELWDAARQAGLRGVILGWMDCGLLAQRDSTKEGTVCQRSSSVKSKHSRFLPVQGAGTFYFSDTRQSFRGKKRHKNTGLREPQMRFNR